MYTECRPPPPGPEPSPPPPPWLPLALLRASAKARSTEDPLSPDSALDVALRRAWFRAACTASSSFLLSLLLSFLSLAAVCFFLGSSFLGSAFFGCSFLGSGLGAGFSFLTGASSFLGSGFGSGLGLGCGSGFLGSSFFMGRSSLGATMGAALVSSLAVAATSAFSAGGVGAGSPSPLSPMGPRMGEGVLFPPGSPSTRLMSTGFSMLMSGCPTGHSQISRITPMCRHRDNIYDASGIKFSSPIFCLLPNVQPRLQTQQLHCFRQSHQAFLSPRP